MNRQGVRRGSWEGRRGLIAVGLLLAVTLLPLGWMQWRQLDQMNPLRLPPSELTHEPNSAASRHLDERNRQLRSQGQLVMGLAALQAALLLLSVGLLVRHIRHQQRQYALLQERSNDLAAARDQAEAANRGKSALLADLSHEIHTPFQGLLDMLDLLDEAPLNGRQRDHLHTARASALHLQEVLNGLLDAATLAPGTQKLSRAPVRLQGLEDEVRGQMRVAATDPPAVAPDLLPNADGRARKLRVLVAEDHPINLKYMRILLDRMGHSAVFCENGQEAIDLLQREPFDVLLLDYHMPVLDGLATTEAIRRLHGPAASVPVVLVTADVVHDTRKRATAVGVTALASKPLQIDDLQRAFAHCGLHQPVAAAGPGDAPPSDRLPSQRPGLAPPSGDVLAPGLPARLSDPQAPAALLVDVASYTEIVSMMPADGLDELLGTVFDRPAGTVHVLADAIQAGDLQAVAHNAHMLKGACMLMGFRLLAQTSAQIEQLATPSTHPLPTGLAHQLLREAERTREALKPFSNSRAASVPLTPVR